MRNINEKLYFVWGLVVVLFLSFAASVFAREQYDGFVSWYGPGFHSRLTANGEEYNMYGLTAAHRTWKFGTLVEVYNKQTKRKCIIRVNDRGPVATSLLMDLSYGAAMAVSSRDLGKVQARLTIVGDSNGVFDKECVFYLFLDDTIILPDKLEIDVPQFNKEYYRNIAGGVEIYQLTQKHIRRLFQAKVENAPDLLVSIDRHICLGPYTAFKDVESVYHKLATLYPHASVWLEKKDKAKRLIRK